MISFVVSQSESGQTLEKFVKKVLPNAPLSFIYKIFRKKDVKVNDHHQEQKFIVSFNDVVKIYVTDSQLEDFKNKRVIKAKDDVSNYIVYEDDNILILNKPRGLLVQKDRDTDYSLNEMVLSYLSLTNKENSSFNAGAAHRIDRNTSGLIVFGKTFKALEYLFTLFKDKELISKHYICLVKGIFDKKDGEINLPLSKNNNKNMVYVSDTGKKALTKYHVIKEYKNYSLVEVIILTGRTHQIRVHMAAINHPIIGDNKYGDFSLNKEFENKYNFTNQFLHAQRLDFGPLEPPLNNISNRHFECEMNQQMKDILSSLDKE